MFIRIGGNAVLPLDFRDWTVNSRLRSRQEDKKPDGNTRSTTTFIIIGVVVGIIALVGLLIFVRRRLGGRKIRYRQTHDNDDEPDTTTNRYRRRAAPSTRQPPNRDSTATATTNSTAAVDRNTSVRSVMTLPAYSAKASDTEQILGREGERGGIDVVVELPTAEDEEALREQEMDALFQIRETRRRQIAEQEERRRERREARERSDAAAIIEIRNRAREARTANPAEIEELRDEHNRIKETRQRAVSSVSYHDLGVARHDGTRIRANSTESTERVGLLSDAASIAASNRSPSALSHRRERSSSSLSINTDGGDGYRPASPYLDTGGRSRADSGATTPRYERAATPSGRSRAGSSPEIIEAGEVDLGEGELPPHSPPGYDDVSLDEITPVHSRAQSPYPDPPPDYNYVRPSAEERRSSYGQRLSVQGLGVVMGSGSPEMASEDGDGNGGSERRNSRGVGGVPQLPSLRLGRHRSIELPQIVIEPSSAQPRER